jgi:diguanylate cyclase (GGDEF)-like protein
MHYTEFLPDNRREKFLEFFNRALSGITTEKEDYPMSEVMGEATVMPVMDERGQVESVLFYVRDVTVERAKTARDGRDSLTGLARRGVLQVHVESLVRTRTPFHLLFIDLDGFKTVNDTMGHKTGDVVLKGVAQALRQSTRNEDLAVRLGGDEFVVVLIDARQPHDVAERLLQAVLAATRPFKAGASIGMATHPKDGVTLDELLATADVAMYRAKKMLGGSIIERSLPPKQRL